MAPKKVASGAGVPESSAKLDDRRGSGRRFHRRGHHLGVDDHGGQQHRGEQLPAGAGAGPSLLLLLPIPPSFARTPHTGDRKDLPFYNHISNHPKKSTSPTFLCREIGKHERGYYIRKDFSSWITAIFSFGGGLNSVLKTGKPTGVHYLEGATVFGGFALCGSGV